MPLRRRPARIRAKRRVSARAVVTAVTAACLITVGPPTADPQGSGGRLVGFDIPLPSAIAAVDALAPERLGAPGAGAEGYPAFEDYPVSGPALATVAGAATVAGQRPGFGSAATVTGNRPGFAAPARARLRGNAPALAGGGAETPPLRRAGARAVAGGAPAGPSAGPTTAAGTKPATAKPSAPPGPGSAPDRQAPAGPSTSPAQPSPPTQPSAPGPPPPATPAPPGSQPPTAEPVPPAPATAPEILNGHIDELRGAWGGRTRPDGAAAEWDDAAALGLWWALVEHCTNPGGAGRAPCLSAADAMLGALGIAVPDRGRWGSLPPDGRQAGYVLTRRALGSGEDGSSLPAELPAWAVAIGSAGS